MTYHNISAMETAKNLDSNIQNGLTEKQAKSRLSEYGKNILDEKKSTSFFVRFFSQFNDFMIIVLLVSAVVSFSVSLLQGDADFIDPVIILAIVMLNAVLGVVQESKAEKSLSALKKISAPSARVRRGGRTISVAASDVVPGDVLILRAGDLVPADARIVKCSNFQVDESSLTGESIPVLKNEKIINKAGLIISEMENTVFSSTFAVTGRCEAIAVKTGMDTEVGKIAGMIISSADEQTPLQKKLADVGKILGAGAIFICILVFVLGIARSINPFDMFLTSVSLAVAAIPEGLPAIVTVMLAIGVQRMAGKNAIIRHLPSVETLGGASVICSDKTGTLTQNKMKVTKIISYDDTFALELGSLCTDVEVDGNKAVGTPTETAIVNAAFEKNINKNRLEKQYPRVGELPFDSVRKRMSTIHICSSGRRIITKGAPDILLSLCSHYFDGYGEKILSALDRERILSGNSEMAKDALRVIAVAYKDVPANAKITENRLVFAGLIGMIDPPRPETHEAVSMCKRAGIRPVMITGDHVATASAIARQIGIMTGGLNAMTGEELDTISQTQLERCIDKYVVFARVTPEHKVRIVKAWKARGEIVAMTGDGINDAPALKAADIGCAMGISGTDVAKEAADMVLTDDNFATIVEAVKQGRGIYANIRKAVQFLLSSNIGEILTIFIGLLLGWASPLAAIQLLWVNLVTDSLPAIALGLDPADKYIMRQKPRKAKKGFFSDGLGISIAMEGCMIGFLALLAFAVGRNMFDMAIGRTMSFAVLSISQLVHAFNMRSEHSVFSVGIFKNKYLVLAFIAGVILQISVITVPPFAAVFKAVPLTALQWVYVAFLSVLPLAIVELQKRFSEAD